MEALMGFFGKPKNSVNNIIPATKSNNNTRKNVNIPATPATYSGGRRRKAHRKGSRKAHRKTKKSTRRR